MRQRLLLIVALAVLAAATVGGTVSAAPNVLGTGQDGVTINLPDGQSLDALPACSNTGDDDGDGLADLNDPGCSGPTDGDEYNAPSGGGETTTTTPGTTTTTPDTTTTTPSTEYDESDTGSGGGGGGDNGGGGGGGKDDGNKEDEDGKDGKKKGKGDAGGGGTGAIAEEPIRTPDGKPTASNPSLSVAQFGPAPVEGVPNFMISQFEIPPFMLPIYQACGTQYGVPWPILASIHKIESGFGTNMGPSTAGAIGQMQFLPSSWRAYGVDANDDGRKDPYNPLDAVCAAGRYLKAAGAEDDLRTAIFAYNHADWYVDEVLLVARQYGRLPDGLVGSLTGLTEGAHFPVAARATYADDVSEREILERSKPGARSSSLGGVTAKTISSSPTRRGINIYSRDEAPVVAVNDGVVKHVGHSRRLGNYLVLQDSYGNRFTYARLGAVSKLYPVPKQQKLSSEDFEIPGTKKDAAPDRPASAKDTLAEDSSGDGGANARGSRSSGDRGASARGRRANGGDPVNSEDLRPRLFAYPERPSNVTSTDPKGLRNVDRTNLSGRRDPMFAERIPGYETVKAYLGGVLRFDRRKMEMRPLREGSQVIAGTVLGQLGKTGELAPHVNFAIKPAGKGAKQIDPKPILDGWKLMESTAIYRAEGRSPFNEADVSQVLLMSKSALERHVLSNPRIAIYACGRDDIQTHQIDARILRTLSMLAARGFRLGITSLKCGHSVYTTSGSVSHHSSGNAVDIASVNGRPLLGNQGPGSITEAVIRELLRMQEPNQCDQIISLMDLGGPTFSMADHADHIHCGFTPQYGTDKMGKEFDAVLKPDQWEKLISRISKIDEPQVPRKPSKYSTPAKGGKGSSGAHSGE
jgi:murein DD-endopeptidase MepM/ murein hydrolase activator NlpD